MSHRLPYLDKNVLTINELKEKGNHFNEGSMDLLTIQDNEDAYNRYKLRPRNMKDVGGIDTSTTIFNKKIKFPFGFSPAALHKLAHPDGELATSRAAAKNGIPMALSSYMRHTIWKMS
ncbi:hypothetical protein N7450_010318 [Penicillium hetheringtonii]|uniref:FMN hydroxy acid dehydrogenase domain-containing protein n=1 Tax=Penicillium hetheringtonii TaxID=911720 RepID=A0AAD6GN52_9EURO|nr:hypothetical protein N7450_010318 [Penicillium hetheringtonii]